MHRGHSYWEVDSIPNWAVAKMQEAENNQMREMWRMIRWLGTCIYRANGVDVTPEQLIDFGENAIDKETLEILSQSE